MSGEYKQKRIGAVFFCPEGVKGTANYAQTLTGGTTTTAVFGAVSGLSDDDLLGLQCYFLDGPLAGLMPTITSFTAASGTVGFTAQSTAPLASNTVLIGAFLPVDTGGLAADPQTEDLPRPEMQTLTLTPPSSCPGLSRATGTLPIELSGLETPATAGTSAGEDRISQLLYGMFSRSAPAGSLVDAVTSTTVFDCTVGQGSQFTVGAHINVNGQVRRITDVSTDTITVDRALSALPQTNDIIYQGEEWTPLDSGLPSFTLLILLDGQLLECRGAVFAVTGSATFGQIVTFSVAFSAADWEYTDNYTTIAAMALAQIKPVAFTSGQVSFGMTELAAQQVDFDFGITHIELMDTKENNEFRIGEFKPTTKVIFRNADKVPKSTWEATKVQNDLTVQIGSTPGNCFALAGNCQAESVAQAEQNGYLAWDTQFRNVDDNYDPASSTKMKLIRF